ncbi:translation initiation factor eIF-2B alpha/beta/delta subunit family protein [Stetteria hydrogenophila]
MGAGDFSFDLLLREKSRYLSLEIGLRDIRKYVDPYLLARRVLEFYRAMLSEADGLVGDPDEWRGAASIIAEELATGIPSVTTASVLAHMVQGVVEELAEIELSAGDIKRILYMVSEKIEEYLANSLKAIESRSREILDGKARVAVIGGSLLALHFLKALEPGSRVTVLEGYPERDGVWLYRELGKTAKGVGARLLPDAYTWQAAVESDSILIVLSGVGRTGYAWARAGSLPLAAAAKKLGKRVLGVTTTLAVNPRRCLRELPIPESRLNLREWEGERLAMPIFDLFSIPDVLDGVVTENGFYARLDRLLSESQRHLSRLLGGILAEAFKELGIRLPGQK